MLYSKKLIIKVRIMTYSVVDVKYYVPSGAPGCGKTCTSGTAERPIQLARSRVSHIDVPIKSVP